MSRLDCAKRWLLPRLGIHYYDHRFVGRAHYVGKPGVWVLKDVKPREGAVDPRELAEIPRRIPR